MPGIRVLFFIHFTVNPIPPRLFRPALSLNKVVSLEQLNPFRRFVLGNKLDGKLSDALVRMMNL